ncbi:hypothetical protein [Actinoplanes sp. URMC 104]
MVAPPDAAAADPVGEACLLADGGLTREQWAGHVPGLPYRDSGD